MSSVIQVDPAYQASFVVNSDSILCLIQNSGRSVLKFEFAKFDFLIGFICIVIRTDRLDSVSTFLKDRGSLYFMRIREIMAIHEYQFEKVREEQVRCNSTGVI